jgi:hypothetical protein
MQGFSRQAILLGLLESLRAHESWCGETHVQKSAFFLEEGMGVPLGLDFYMYKYGPFSSDLRQLLGQMRASYLIDVEPREPYGPSLVVSDSGRDLLDRFSRTRTRYAREIEFVATKLGPQPVSELEKLSTALFVRKRGSGATGATPAEQIMQLKPHIDRAQAEAAIGTVAELLREASQIGSGERAAATS